jgi:anti-anti-sigma regulatory factor
MRIHKRVSEGIAVYDVVGDIGRGTHADAFAATITPGEDSRVAVVNVADATCSTIDGLNALLGALLSARCSGCDIRLVGLTPTFADVPVLVALVRHFTVFETEFEAGYVTALGMIHSLKRA